MNAVGALQEFCQQGAFGSPSYEFQDLSQVNKPWFNCTVKLWNSRTFKGEGRSKKEAKQEAANSAYLEVTNHGKVFQKKSTGPGELAPSNNNQPVAPAPHSPSLSRSFENTSLDPSASNPISMVYEICQKQSTALPNFGFIKVSESRFLCSTEIFGQKFESEGQNKQQSKYQTCLKAVQFFYDKNPEYLSSLIKQQLANLQAHPQTQDSSMPQQPSLLLTAGFEEKFVFDRSHPLMLKESELTIPPERSEDSEEVFSIRQYQREILTQAIDSNVIAFLDTGSGKTFIATLLMKHVAHYYACHDERGPHLEPPPRNHEDHTLESCFVCRTCDFCITCHLKPRKLSSDYELLEPNSPSATHPPVQNIQTVNVFLDSPEAVSPYALYFLDWKKGDPVDGNSLFWQERYDEAHQFYLRARTKLSETGEVKSMQVAFILNNEACVSCVQNDTSQPEMLLPVIEKLKEALKMKTLMQRHGERHKITTYANLIILLSQLGTMTSEDTSLLTECYSELNRLISTHQINEDEKPEAIPHSSVFGMAHYLYGYYYHRLVQADDEHALVDLLVANDILKALPLKFDSPTFQEFVFAENKFRIADTYLELDKAELCLDYLGEFLELSGRLFPKDILSFEAEIAAVRKTSTLALHSLCSSKILSLYDDKMRHLVFLDPGDITSLLSSPYSIQRLSRLRAHAQIVSQLDEDQVEDLPLPSPSAPPVVKFQEGLLMIFLVDRVALVRQQAEFLRKHTPFAVRELSGRDRTSQSRPTDPASSKEEQHALYLNHDVVVATAQVFLNDLRAGLVTFDDVQLLVIDECHHTNKGHPFQLIMTEFFDHSSKKPKVFGMTASPVKDSSAHDMLHTTRSIKELAENLHCSLSHLSEVAFDELRRVVPSPSEYLLLFHEKKSSEFLPQELAVMNFLDRFDESGNKLLNEMIEQSVDDSKKANPNPNPNPNPINSKNPAPIGLLPPASPPPEYGNLLKQIKNIVDSEPDGIFISNLAFKLGRLQIGLPKPFDEFLKSRALEFAHFYSLTDTPGGKLVVSGRTQAETSPYLEPLRPLATDLRHHFPSISGFAPLSDSSSNVQQLLALAEAYYKQENFLEAEKIISRDILSKLPKLFPPLGTYHRDTWTVMKNLALVFSAQRKYDLALKEFKHVIEVQQKVLGPEHPDTLDTMNNRAGVYESQGQYDLALKELKHVLEMQERVLGPEHPNTLKTLGNLAFVYQSQGQYDLAFKELKHVLGMQQRVLGPEHPSTLRTMNNLANVYRSQGQYDLAFKELKHVLEMQQRVLGPEHPNTLTTMNNLANVYQSQGQYDLALKEYKHVLEVQQRVLGPEHPDTLATMNNLALVYRSQGHYDLALKEIKCILEVQQRVLGPEHPATLISSRELLSLTSVFRDDDVEEGFCEWHLDAMKIESHSDGAKDNKQAQKDLRETLRLSALLRAILLNLGFWLAEQYWYSLMSCFLESSVFFQIANTHVKLLPDSWKNSYTMRLSELQAYGASPDDDPLLVPSKLPPPSNTLLTPKTLLLLQLFRDHKHMKGFCAIIFVQRRQFVKSLTDLFASHPDTRDISCAGLVGQGSRGGSVVVSRNGLDVSQASVLTEFRNGNIQVLIATSVCEEGIDIPACQMVVRFDGVITSASYVQSRGRARKKDSVYIVMAPEGDERALADVRNARHGRDSMQTVQKAFYHVAQAESPTANSRPSSSSSLSNILAHSVKTVTPIGITYYMSEEMGVIYVEQTQTRVSLEAAVDIFNRFVAKTKSKVDLSYAELPPSNNGVSKFICSGELSGPVVQLVSAKGQGSSKRAANQMWCFAALRILLDRGLVNENMLAVVPSQDDASSKGPSVPAGEKDKPLTQESVYASVPPRWFAFHEFREHSTPLFLYSILVTHTADDLNEDYFFGEEDEDENPDILVDAYRPPKYLKECPMFPFGFVCFERLPSSFNETNPFRVSQYYAASVRFEQKLDLSAAHYTQIQHYHHAVLKDILIISSEPKERERNSSSCYNVPLKRVGGERVEIDWSTMADTVDDLTALRLALAAQASKEPIPGSSPEIARIMGYNFFQARPDDMANHIAVMTYPPHRRYLMHEVCSSMSAVSPFPAKKGASLEFTNFKHYVETKYNVIVEHPDAPIIKASHCSVRQYVKDVSVSALHLVLDTCLITRMSGLALALPSIMSTLSHSLRAVEGAFLILDILALPPPEISTMIYPYPTVESAPPNFLIQAFTCTAANAKYNLERLELLGDAYLKYFCSFSFFFNNPTMNEGQLSKLRTSRTNNKVLFNIARTQNLFNYILVAAPNYKQWRPSGWVSKSLHIPDKGLADTVEAIIGALLLFEDRLDIPQGSVHNLLQKWGIVDSLGLQPYSIPFPPHVTRMPVYLDYRVKLTKFQTKQLLYPDPTTGALVPYIFKQPLLLIEAFTHPSCSDAMAVSDYQRLEFLGDAAFDYLVTTYFYHKYPDLSPGDLTDLRQASVSSLFMARVARKHKFHECIRFESSVLYSDLVRFLRLQKDSEADDPPKFLSDVFEAVGGAILVDGGYEAFKMVYSHLIEEFLNKYATPETVEISWKRKLLEACQASDLVFEYRSVPSSRRQEMVIHVVIKGKVYGQGSGFRRHAAELRATQDAFSNPEFIALCEEGKVEKQKQAELRKQLMTNEKTKLEQSSELSNPDLK